MGMAVTKKIPPLDIVMLLFIVVQLLSQVQPSAPLPLTASNAPMACGLPSPRQPVLVCPFDEHRLRALHL